MDKNQSNKKYVYPGSPKTSKDHKFKGFSEQGYINMFVVFVFSIFSSKSY